MSRELVIVPVPPSPLRPMSSLLREIVTLTASMLTSPVQAGSKRNAARAAAAAGMRAREWAAVRVELDAAAAIGGMPSPGRSAS